MRIASSRSAPDLVLAGAVGYLLLTGWAMNVTTFDVWGALVVFPILALATGPAVRRLFRGLRPALVPIGYVAFVVHMAGCVVRHWVAYDAYEGLADSANYHSVGARLAGVVRDDPLQITSVVPTPTGTVFVEKLTGLLYVVTGPSKMAGFLVFGWFAFLGCCLFVRAACVGIRELDQRRYALVVLFLPSLVYWPSSIGKESWMIATLGLGSYGMARLWSGNGWLLSSVVAALGIGGAACVRPHVAAMWAVGALFASLAIVVAGRRDGHRRLSPLATLATIALALLAALVVGRAAISYLDTGEDDAAPVTDRISSILEVTERRTSIGGSGFAPPSTDGPLDWPYAIVRTLTRPLLMEANSVSSLLPALEMTVILVLAATGIGRLAAVPLVLLRRQYLAFAVATTAVYGLAFANIGNLAILTRQRSIILPLLVVPLCLRPLSALRRPLPPAPRPQKVDVR